MLAALRGLTTRGRCFVAAAIATAVAAFLLGENDLLRIAVLLLILPVLACIAVGRTRFRLSCSRTISPDRIQVGNPTQVVLRLENMSRIPTGLMLLEDHVPYALGSRPRFILNRLRSHAASSVTYSVRADVRGRYDLGPLTVRLSDPFGLCEVTRSFVSTSKLVVTPVVTPLPAVRISGERSGSGESRARSVAVHGEDDAATREYRHGDDLRKVHWRSTARTGELMVRREEQPWHSKASLLLDTRAIAHRGDGPTSSFEWSVSAIASAGVHLGRAGYTTRLVTDSGNDLASVDASFGGEGVLLDFLSEIRDSDEAHLGAAAQLLRRETGGLVVAVVGLLSLAEAEQLATIRTAGTICVAIVVDSSTWLGDTLEDSSDEAEVAAQHQAAVRALIGAGWRVLTAEHGSRIENLWPFAASRSGGFPASSTSPSVENTPLGAVR